MSHKKYVREQIAEYDKQQAKLTLNGIAKNVATYVVIITQLQPEKIMICPFCLGQHKTMKFYISKKNGIDKRLGKCPECQNQMLLKTLISMLKWNAQEFAKWVYDYRLSGFWQKVNFNVWKKRLFDLNMSYEFWEEYKNLKGEQYTTEEEYAWSSYNG